jgi:hypothetical protein
MRHSRVVAALLVGLAMSPTATMRAQSAAPNIIFSASPALLILVDGDPVFRNVPGTALQRLVNTKVLIVRDETGVYYLRILDGWMESYALRNWWSVSGVPPDGAEIALKQARASKTVDLLDGGPASANAPPSGERPALTLEGAPAIYVSTTPAALIVTDGPARFASLAGTSLQYVVNTAAKVFREPTDQELYVLLSGRWFRSWRTEGPWQPIAITELPADLARISDSQLKSSPGGFE